MALRVHNEVAPIAATWDELADRAAAAPWSRPGWIDAWWQTFGQGPLRIFALHRGDGLAAVLPLAARRGTLGAAANWHTPSFGVLAESGEARAQLLAAILEQRPRSVALRFLDAESGDPEALVAAADAAGYATTRRVHARSPYIAIAGTLDDYLRSGRPRSSVLKDLRRCRRRLEEQGPVRLRIEDGRERLDELVETAFRLEGSGWKERNGSAIASRPETRRFYAEVIRWAAARGTLRLAFLDCGDVPVAVDILLEENNRLLDLKGGFDAAHRTMAPGKILLRELVEHCYARGLESLDLLGSDEPYKLQWTATVRERVEVRAFAPTAAGRAERLVHAHAAPAARGLMQRVERYRSRRQTSSASSDASSS